jgi:hypothetical protein
MSDLVPKRKPQPAHNAARKYAGFSGYSFAVGIALHHLDGLLHHNVQPMIVQQLEEDEDDQSETDDPQVLFHRQLRRIRRGDTVNRLVLRMR